MGEQADTIPAVVVAAAARRPDAVALRDATRSLTFAQLADCAASGAAALARLGVGAGGAVAIWAPNSVDWVIAALAVAGAGGVLVPINTRAKGADAADAITRARCATLVTTSGFLGIDYIDLLHRAGPLPAVLRDIVVLAGDDADGAAVGHVARHSWASLVHDAGDRRVWRDVDPGAISHIQFTSGTTGRPKGAMLRHRALCGTTRDWCATVGLGPEDRYLVVSPMFHISGHKTGVLACLTTGAACLPQPVFDPVTVMARVAAEHITVLPGPPTIYQALLDHPRRAEFDLSSLRLAVTGAASIPPVLVERMRDELGFDTVITAYGVTETTGVVTMCRPGDDPRTIAETSGRAVPGVEVRIAPGTGEILVRGYNVMAGYLDDDAATAAAIDTDGWFHTGDVGDLDDAGNLRITDRLTDMFQVGGFNTYPAEIEAAMLRHPMVAQVAIVGVPHPRLGEVGHAFVVPRAGVAASADELLAWCREQLANYKVPRAVTFVDELPTNASGKVLKFELRQRARQA